MVGAGFRQAKPQSARDADKPVIWDGKQVITGSTPKLGPDEQNPQKNGQFQAWAELARHWLKGNCFACIGQGTGSEACDRSHQDDSGGVGEKACCQCETI